MTVTFRGVGCGSSEQSITHRTRSRRGPQKARIRRERAPGNVAGASVPVMVRVRVGESIMAVAVAVVSSLALAPVLGIGKTAVAALTAIVVAGLAVMTVAVRRGAMKERRDDR